MGDISNKEMVFRSILTDRVGGGEKKGMPASLLSATALFVCMLTDREDERTGHFNLLRSHL